MTPKAGEGACLRGAHRAGSPADDPCGLFRRQPGDEPQFEQLAVGRTQAGKCARTAACSSPRTSLSPGSGSVDVPSPAAGAIVGRRSSSSQRRSSCGSAAELRLAIGLVH